MKIYKIEKVYVSLLVILLAASFIFAFSHALIGGNNIKFIIIGFLILFIIFNIVNLLGKKVEIDENSITIKSLTGKRKLEFDKIEDITPLKLKGRYIFIISDNEKYGFLSSMFEKFDEILDILKKNAQNSNNEKISGITIKDINSRKKIFIAFLISATIFLIAASVLNFATL